MENYHEYIIQAVPLRAATDDIIETTRVVALEKKNYD